MSNHAECKELYLGGKGIEKLRGFEPFVNLECLWLNNNKLKKINNLDANFRIKALYAQVCACAHHIQPMHTLLCLTLHVVISQARVHAVQLLTPVCADIDGSCSLHNKSAHRHEHALQIPFIYQPFLSHSPSLSVFLHLSTESTRRTIRSAPCAAPCNASRSWRLLTSPTMH